MKIKKLGTLFNKAEFRLKKNSPEILIVAGVIGTVASAIVACRATLKVNDILSETKENVDKIHYCLDDDSMKERYSKDDAKKDLAMVYAKTGVKIARLYAPAVIMGGLSIAGILFSNNILRKRNVALVAAYTAVDKSMKEYRKRVVERFGEGVDRELRYNIKAKEIDMKTTDENGKEEITKEKACVIGDHYCSGYERCFDECNPNWQKDNGYNRNFLMAQQNYANDLLRAKGYLFLNDVYKMLGFPETKEGQVVGWVYNQDDDDIDSYVDFNMFEVHDEAKRAFVNGYERSIFLDFNVDGYILDNVNFSKL